MPHRQISPISAYDIAERRKALGLTQAELAKLAKIGRSTLAKIEAGGLASEIVIQRIWGALRQKEQACSNGS